MDPDRSWYWDHVQWGELSIWALSLGPCLEWTWTRTLKGYGAAKYRGGGGTTAHRFAWTIFMGPPPLGYLVDHLCRNRGCVNLQHLEPITPIENSRRGSIARQLVGDPGNYLWVIAWGRRQGGLPKSPRAREILLAREIHR